MAPGRKRFTKLQMGKESPAGTAVAATSIWRGVGNQMSDDQVVEQIDELVGIAGGTDRSAVTALLAGIELAETPMTYEQLQYLLALAFGGPTAGIQDGSGSDYVYTTNVPETAGPTAAPYTWEAGDDREAAEMEYAVCTEFTLKGQAGQTAKMAGKLIGRQVTQSAFTGALSAPSVEDSLVSKGKVYLDAVTGSYGGTQVATQIIAYELKVASKWSMLYSMDGQLYYTLPVWTGYEITGKLTFVHDSAVLRSGTGTAAGAKVHFAGQTPRLLRIDLIGGAVATPGTTYSTKKVVLDLPIKYTKAGVLGEKDGISIVDMEFRSRYNLTKTDAGQFVIVNELVSLP